MTVAAAITAKTHLHFAIFLLETGRYTTACAQVADTVLLKLHMGNMTAMERHVCTWLQCCRMGQKKGV